MSMRIPPNQLASLNRKLTKWADSKEKVVADANYKTALAVRNGAIKRFRPAKPVQGPGQVPRWEIGNETDAQGRLLPHLRSRLLRNSIAALRGNGVRAYVEAGVDQSYGYAAHVEFGTRFMRPRPYLFPAAEEQRRPHKEEIKRAYQTRVTI